MYVLTRDNQANFPPVQVNLLFIIVCDVVYFYIVFVAFFGIVFILSVVTAFVGVKLLTLKHKNSFTQP